MQLRCTKLNYDCLCNIFTHAHKNIVLCNLNYLFVSIKNQKKIESDILAGINIALRSHPSCLKKADKI